jgi:hypothetical protein
MTDTNEGAGQRDRSPAFPVLPLEAALGKLTEFEAHYKRSAARPEKVGEAWSIKTKAYADRIAAALRYFGLLEYQGSGKERSVVVSEIGRTYLRAKQEVTKLEIIKAAALRPKQIAKFWADWGPDRPADAACIDELTLKNSFSDVGARDFLKVYDATIAYAGLSEHDKSVADLIGDTPNENHPEDEESGSDDAPPKRDKVKVMAGERELTTGLLSKDASFRLIVSGDIGVREIERLIQKLQIDKDILADFGEAEDEATTKIIDTMK